MLYGVTRRLRRLALRVAALLAASGLRPPARVSSLAGEGWED